MTDPLASVLTALAEQARPARIDPGTWRKGRRRRRLRVAGAMAAAVMVLVAVPFLVAQVGNRSMPPADQPGPVVPSTVYSPVTGDGTIVSSPGGPAAILVTGDKELMGSDIWGWEGRSLVVGQNGSYRLARTVGQTSAGAGGLLLSPDGRYLAGIPLIEGAHRPHLVELQTGMVDLTTGKGTFFTGGGPVAWSRDGRSLLIRQPIKENSSLVGHLGLLDIQTGSVRALPAIAGRWREGNFAAFASDGSGLAIATETELHVIDLRLGTARKLAALGSESRLAGPGAWLPGDRRLAVYRIGGCYQPPCSEDQLGKRRFQIEYLDVQTGLPVAGPALTPAQGLAAQLLGWQRDGDAVVAVYAPEDGARWRIDDMYWSETDYWVVGSVELSEFRVDGGQHRLVNLPSSALFVDVPANLLDSFGGPSPTAFEGRVRWLLAIYWPIGQLCELLVVAGIGLLIYRAVRRRRLRRAHAAGRASG